MRGYAAVGLDHVKNRLNVGSTLRSCYNYGTAFLATSGSRYRRAPTDTQKAYRHMPLLQVDDLRDIIPYDCVPVAVDLVPDAIPLHAYKHPERAIYIFGAEDNTLGKRVLSWCRDVIYIPTTHCLNLAVTVGTVLYDRQAKQLQEWA